MSKKNIKIVAQYQGHQVKKNSDVDLNFKADYGEIVNTLELVTLINRNITVISKVGDSKPTKLGLFSLKQIAIDGDGESKIRLNSEVDYVQMENLNTLLEPEVLIVLMFTVEDTDADDEDEDDEE